MVERREIPGHLTFRMYSYLCRREVDHAFHFLNRVGLTLNGEKIDRGDVSWRKEMDDSCMYFVDRTCYADSLLLYSNENPAAFQCFCIEEGQAFGLGTFVDKRYRKRGLTTILREVLYARLLNGDISNFHIGEVDNLVDREIKRTKEAQSLARSDLKHGGDAISKSIFTPEKKFVVGYSFDLSKYEFKYDVSGEIPSSFF